MPESSPLAAPPDSPALTRESSMPLARPALALLALVGLAAPTSACSIPVFRYALERWQPSSYTVHVFHRGPLTVEQHSLVERLQDDNAPANVRIVRTDLADHPEPARLALWRRVERGLALPALVLQYPEEDEAARPVWTGSLTRPAVNDLLDSPARRALTDRLASGASAVWILLLSGDAGRDQVARRLLTAELDRLRTAMQLPLPDDDTPLRSHLPLRVAFSILPIRRDDPAESVLVRMLLGSEDGLTDETGPLVYPVFGRGRALIALRGSDLTAAEVERWASFLAGPCSCQVKELNPGIDLLLTADWEERLGVSEANTEIETLPRVPPVVPAIPPGRGHPVPVPAATPAEQPQVTPMMVVPLLVVLFTAALCLRRRGGEAHTRRAGAGDGPE